MKAVWPADAALPGALGSVLPSFICEKFGARSARSFKGAAARPDSCGGRVSVLLPYRGVPGARTPRPATAVPRLLRVHRLPARNPPLSTASGSPRTPRHGNPRDSTRLGLPLHTLNDRSSPWAARALAPGSSRTSHPIGVRREPHALANAHPPRRRLCRPRGGEA